MVVEVGNPEGMAAIPEPPGPGRRPIKSGKGALKKIAPVRRPVEAGLGKMRTPAPPCVPGNPDAAGQGAIQSYAHGPQ